MYGLGLILDSAMDETYTEEKFVFQTSHLCSHCHRKIEGKAYLIGENFYDKRCYSYRYMFEDMYEKERLKSERKRKAIKGK